MPDKIIPRFPSELAFGNEETTEAGLKSFSCSEQEITELRNLYNNVYYELFKKHPNKKCYSDKNLETLIKAEKETLFIPGSNEHFTYSDLQDNCFSVLQSIIEQEKGYNEKITDMDILVTIALMHLSLYMNKIFVKENRRMPYTQDTENRTVCQLTNIIYRFFEKYRLDKVNIKISKADNPEIQGVSGIPCNMYHLFLQYSGTSHFVELLSFHLSV